MVKVLPSDGHIQDMVTVSKEFKRNIAERSNKMDCRLVFTKSRTWLRLSALTTSHNESLNIKIINFSVLYSVLNMDMEIHALQLDTGLEIEIAQSSTRIEQTEH